MFLIRKNIDFNIKDILKKKMFFLQGFASPDGPGPGPASQEGPGPSPYCPSWGHMDPHGPILAHVKDFLELL